MTLSNFQKFGVISFETLQWKWASSRLLRKPPEYSLDERDALELRVGYQGHDLLASGIASPHVNNYGASWHSSVEDFGS